MEFIPQEVMRVGLDTVHPLRSDLPKTIRVEGFRTLGFKAASLQITFAREQLQERGKLQPPVCDHPTLI